VGKTITGITPLVPGGGGGFSEAKTEWLTSDKPMTGAGNPSIVALARGRGGSVEQPFFPGRSRNLNQASLPTLRRRVGLPVGAAARGMPAIRRQRGNQETRFISQILALDD